jgi:hypothetical protein
MTTVTHHYGVALKVEGKEYSFVLTCQADIRELVRGTYGVIESILIYPEATGHKFYPLNSLQVLALLLGKEVVDIREKVSA